ncbi:hypothetical protein LXL04_030621 [Taraxacum kok-saghyz]
MPIVEVTTHTHLPIKLNSSNFPVWRKQVVATLTGLGLESYITGDTEAPSKVLAADNTKANPAYLPWFRQDQIILGAILGSCLETIQPVVSSAETAREAFQRLTESYASVSRSRIISLKSRLANNPKGTRSITEFLHDMKNIADDLALAQSPVDEEDLVVHVLGQLGDDYTHIASALKIRDTPIKFPDLFEKLLDHERTLKDTQSPSVIAIVNSTQKQSNRNPPIPTTATSPDSTTTPVLALANLVLQINSMEVTTISEVIGTPVTVNTVISQAMILKSAGN